FIFFVDQLSRFKYHGILRTQLSFQPPPDVLLDICRIVHYLYPSFLPLLVPSISFNCCLARPTWFLTVCSLSFRIRAIPAMLNPSNILIVKATLRCVGRFATAFWIFCTIRS